MKSYSKILASVLAASMTLAAAGCSGSAPSQNSSTGNTNTPSANSSQTDAATDSEDKVLTLYSTESDDLINLIVPGFEKKTGIKVDLITAGSGEILKRLQSEKDAPIADALLGTSYLMAKANEDLFEVYQSPEDANVIEGFKNDGAITQYKKGCSVLLVNKDLIGDIEIKGYQDLLNPALKGKIAATDAAASSSAFDHLVNMLIDMSPNHENESDVAWQYVQDLLFNIDGKLLNGSSAVYKGVADGEYTVGITWEDPSATYLKNGATNLEVVYMEEGVAFMGSAVMVVKGAKHPDNAKAFLDYTLSDEVQNKLGTEACLRPVRAGATLGSHMLPEEQINVVTADIPWVSENKTRLSEKFTDLVTNVG